MVVTQRLQRTRVQDLAMCIRVRAYWWWNCITMFLIKVYIHSLIAAWNYFFKSSYDLSSMWTHCSKFALGLWSPVAKTKEIVKIFRFKAAYIALERLIFFLSINTIFSFSTAVFLWWACGFVLEVSRCRARSAWLCWIILSDLHKHIAESLNSCACDTCIWRSVFDMKSSTRMATDLFTCVYLFDLLVT